jgi:hypothetical protein
MLYFCLSDKDKVRVVDEIYSIKGPCAVEISPGEQRTIQQNARHFGMLQGATQYLKNAGIFNGDVYALHTYCKRQILGTKAITLGDEVFYLDAKSHRMTKKQFKLFDEKLEPFLLNELEVPYEYLLPPGGNWQ